MSRSGAARRVVRTVADMIALASRPVNLPKNGIRVASTLRKRGCGAAGPEKGLVERIALHTTPTLT